MEIQVNVAITPETIKAIQGLMKQGVKDLEAAEERTQKKKKGKAKEEPEEESEEETSVEDLDETEPEEELEEEAEEELEEELEETEEEEDQKIDAKQLAQLKKALNSYSAKHGKPKAVKILHKYAKVSQDVKAEDFSKVMKALKV